MHSHDIPARAARLAQGSRRALLVAAVALAVGAASPAVSAAPAAPLSVAASRLQNVDWISPDQAASLDVGIQVLVPAWVPAPFDAVAPSVAAADGYYEFYWMVPGGPPTFLQITGILGGSLPAGSPADLNKQLFVNATVQGWPAIHDIGIPAGSDTPIYDQVWWVADGVLYSVSSLNMTGSDSLSLANALVPLQAPSAPAPEEPVVEEPEPQVPSEPVPDGGADAVGGETGEAAEAAAAEVPSEDVGASTEGMPTEPVPGSDAGVDAEQPADEPAGNGAAGESGPLPSDGTDGPPRPPVGSDGTGGVQDLALPSQR